MTGLSLNFPSSLCMLMLGKDRNTEIRFSPCVITGGPLSHLPFLHLHSQPWRPISVRPCKSLEQSKSVNNSMMCNGIWNSGLKYFLRIFNDMGKWLPNSVRQKTTHQHCIYRIIPIMWGKYICIFKSFKEYNKMLTMVTLSGEAVGIIDFLCFPNFLR